jgi:mannose-6-phosphate isomerase
VSLLPIRSVEKPWGREALPAPFVAPAGRRIGEVWFEPPACLPQLLVKYIFTSENLSVQVHPDDAQTLAQGIGRQGKEECWLVLAAEPGARLGIGFREKLDTEAMRAAAIDGSIEGLMVWHEVAPGDFFYIPAGTVHAIGAGVSLIEVQQNSDITYRLYDYGRPRELHLDDGLAVARGEVYDLARWHRQLPARGNVRLVDGPHFRLDRVDGAGPGDWRGAYVGQNMLVVPLTGLVKVAGQNVAAGACALAATTDEIACEADALFLVAQAIEG